jgi:HAD superfamily hydrolase (TIGR01459 family)
MHTFRGVPGIIDLYDAYFVDVWGVLYHEGLGVIETALPGLQRLRQANKRVILISNASRSSQTLSEFLEREGVARSLYNHAVTSGDCTRAYFESFEKSVSCYFMGQSHNRVLFRDLPVVFVEDIACAEVFVLCALDTDSTTIDPFVPFLDRCLDAGLSLVCANPDEYVLIEGQRIVRPGLLARYYAEHGGKVFFFGKPYAPIYERARMFVPDVPKNRILGIGDGLKTDILGAQNFGIDSLWIRSGVDHGRTEADISPTYVLNSFV